MNRHFPLAGLIIGLLAWAGALRAQSLPLALDQLSVQWNYQSTRGVPISSVSNSPAGSDGRQPLTNSSLGSLLVPTTNQFRYFQSLSGVPGLTSNNWLSASNSVYLKGTNAFSGIVANQMYLPCAQEGTNVLMVLRRCQIASPYFSRLSTLDFGSVISVPVTDLNGISLSNSPADYWQSKPYLATYTNGFYYSESAQKVYAIQSGPLMMQWLTKAYTSTQPSDFSTNASAYYLKDGNYYRVYTASYVVSGSTAQTPRKMYWTENSFSTMGKPISVPSGRIGAVKVVHNTVFPETVATPYVAPGEYVKPGANQKTQTLWYDATTHQIYAYNVEGRVLVELIDLSGKQLGIEIVDVYKRANPEDVTIELGEVVTPPAPGTLDTLAAGPIPNENGTTYVLQQYSGSELTLYATRETVNENDYFVYWMETGVAGLQWPASLGRYRFRWPTDPARYSHYLRPQVSTEEEAKLTAVPLPTANVPTLDYQDFLDHPRGGLTETYAYYTFLDPWHPLHRALLHYSSGNNVRFERVLSWLDGNLKAGAYSDNYTGNPVAAGLDGWNPTNQTLNIPDSLSTPRVVNATANVGQRLNAPSGETGNSGTAYLAGHINPLAGISYNPGAYEDPLTAGFEVANKSSIIPVNAIPGNNILEVWWFRSNGANTNQGFATVYWPSVLGRYTVQWPTDSREIVLASKLGSGTLLYPENLGTLYSQNTQGETGYNPNEEHAIIDAGTVYATRDDLNLTNAATYSSAPFVLLQYADTDGRPSMSLFKVLREKPSAGYVFDYLIEAGQKLQPPMPLPLLGQPVEGSGDAATNYNTEFAAGSGDWPGGWNPATSRAGPFKNYDRFTYEDRKHGYWAYRGPHAGWPALRAGTYVNGTTNFNNLSNAVAVINQPFALTLHASRPAENLALTSLSALPPGLAINGLSLTGTPTNAATNTIQLVINDLYDGSRVSNTLVLQVRASGSIVAQGPLMIQSTNLYTGSIVIFSNRAPCLAVSANPSNSFAMQYYYRTEESFAWPGLANPPAAGSIVPYLRPLDGTGTYVGDPSEKGIGALKIVYRPVWPVSDGGQPLLSMPYGQTLVKPVDGLPGVGDWKTAQVLYQQSIAANINSTNGASVVLYDPTREKIAPLTNYDLAALPSSVRTETYQGKVYFPNLPPHLAKRFYFDPNRGGKGSLVLKGEFKDETVGQDYLLLNVLRGSDLTNAWDVCPPADAANRPKWVAAINGLATQVETFHENPAVPGTYVADAAQTVSVGVGDLAEITSDNVAKDSCALSATGPGSGYITLIESGGNAFTQPGDPVALHILKVGGSLYSGEIKVIPAENPLSELISFQHTPDLAGRFTEYEYQWKIAAPVDGLPPSKDATMSSYRSLTPIAPNLPRYTLGGAGIEVLGDNYLTLRYRPINPAHPLYSAATSDTATNWSAWTEPQLAEGWIKRVVAGINPFNQRTKDLINNPVNTDSSILTQAGHRWEGDVSLNLDTLNNYGLIEIYETVLRRGRMLSIDSGYNYGPANDALLLAAGYLNDLYMMVGNEAWADAANPTIGIGTADRTYGSIATALFAFKGQEPSLLEEELALIRGRPDSLLPGVETAPVYNRLVWNYTRGIDAGEVIYALNYNILDQNYDGVVNAEDAARLFPMGHGDAYGHYLTALKGYYSLLLNPNFDWVPRSESVSVLGQPVSVDYQDERKFAAAAAAAGRAGRQIFDLTWRKDYQPDHTTGWGNFRTVQVNAQRSYTDLTEATVHPARYWALDHWASRIGQGQLLNWLVGNAIVPDHDPNPDHAGSIQQIDRSTVPELIELATQLRDLQTAMDNAEGGLTPLGLPSGSVALDIDPNQVVGGANGTHFEQIYTRAKATLNNAVAAFDDAKNVTQLMRSEQDSLAGVRASLLSQEQAFTNQLIELYGTPYTDDIGPGKTYKQGYAGPDLIHYPYTDTPQLTFPGLLTNTEPQTFRLDIQDFNKKYESGDKHDFGFYVTAENFATANLPDYSLNIKKIDLVSIKNYFESQQWFEHHSTGSSYLENTQYIRFTLDSSGDFLKPISWVGRRASPGKIQKAIARIQLARNSALGALSGHEALKRKLDRSIDYFKSVLEKDFWLINFNKEEAILKILLNNYLLASEMGKETLTIATETAKDQIDVAKEGIPDSTVVGTSSGGDLTSPAAASLEEAKKNIGIFQKTAIFLKNFSTATFKNSLEGYTAIRAAFFDQPIIYNTIHKQQVLELDATLVELQQTLYTVNHKLQELDQAQNDYRALAAEGDRLIAVRQVERQRVSAIIQGYRSRDAAFRVFRNEKLERYKTLFDLAARYSLLAANAYDYETGLLNSDAGRSFINRIISARALGVIQNGEPQYAGSSTGDPGLSSALAEMKADWDVLKGRLGFNNPDAYGTTASLRTEKFRILPTTNGNSNWQDVLQQARKSDILSDPDVARYCMQIDPKDGTPVPGIVLEFSTTIADGYNLFGNPGTAGDHAFNSASFATKIFAAGVALEGYHGMDAPSANSSSGGASPSDPNSWYLDTLGLMATPYVYLIPVGEDSMRSPPLGDASTIRSWNVLDIAVPMPFNISASILSSGGFYQSADSLSEPIFTVRKHQSFRPVPSASCFSTSLYTQTGGLQRSQYTNNRLIGRSAWNSHWKLVIPGKNLLNNPDEGLERFIKTVTDIKLHFVTYSYSGN